MASPNYQFEKRRRDLEKKAKKEEKRLRKLAAAKEPGAPSEPGTEPGTEPDAEPGAESEVEPGTTTEPPAPAGAA